MRGQEKKMKKQDKNKTSWVLVWEKKKRRNNRMGQWQGQNCPVILIISIWLYLWAGRSTGSASVGPTPANSLTTTCLYNYKIE